MLAYLLARKSA